MLASVLSQQAELAKQTQRMKRPIDKMAPGVIRSNKQKKNGCMTILCQFANTYKNTVITEYHFGLEPNSKFQPPPPNQH